MTQCVPCGLIGLLLLLLLMLLLLVWFGQVLTVYVFGS